MDKQPRDLKDALSSLVIDPSMLQKKERKDNYAFWNTQPVTQFEEGSALEVC
jgi:hypothetical protein